MSLETQQPEITVVEVKDGKLLLEVNLETALKLGASKTPTKIDDGLVPPIVSFLKQIVFKKVFRWADEAKEEPKGETVT